MTMNPSLRDTCITPLKTMLLDLPTEVLQNILDFASRDIERRQLYKYRLVNRMLSTPEMDSKVYHVW